MKDWQNSIDTKNILEKYRVTELIRLIDEVEKIKKLTCGLILKTLDYIEIDSAGKVEVVFLEGIKVKL